MVAEIPQKMKAAVLYGWNDIRYVDVETPQFGPREALCRVLGCGICGTDPHIIEGHFEGLFPPGFPFIAGHEWYGEVVALGSEVKNLSLGQRVIGEPQKGCGACPRCMEGRYHLCMNAPHIEKGYELIGHNKDGAYAEYVAVNAITLHVMPENLGLEEGVSACNVGIGMEAVRRGRIDLGDDVVVIGVGLLGLLIIQLARIAGAARIMAVGRGNRLEVAGELGADQKIDRSQVDVVEKVKEITGGVGADVVIEVAGAEEAVLQSMDCVRKGGRVVLAGLGLEKGVPFDTDRIVFDEIEIIGTRGAPNALAESIKLLSSGRLDVKPLITHKLPLSEINKGIEIFTKRIENAIRVALIP